ncbi:hypothetical protein [Paenibacillus sp. OV219]|uniref:hypothetical protein n=1 Tax=Paenibacillus sp. OV219 TaxID=1884377 RepID=UPI0008B2FDD6|nr:hypothetical protein [Paenibacillus sp. OV219]SEO87528.1 hypothetical protein SAMN05518847_1129 [Paenibacillus sp. OV219]
MRFALQDRLTGKSDYSDIFAEAKQLGYDGVEITHHGAPLTEQQQTKLYSLRSVRVFLQAPYAAVINIGSEILTASSVS